MLVILLARSKLVASGTVRVLVNEERELDMSPGVKLMNGLADADLFVASACGGGGTCAQCRCQVPEGGGGILSTEEGHFTRGEISENVEVIIRRPSGEEQQVSWPWERRMSAVEPV